MATLNDLHDALVNFNVSDTVQISFIRDGQQLRVAGDPAGIGVKNAAGGTIRRRRTWQGSRLLVAIP